MIYTVVMPSGRILLDKGSSKEFDQWLNENRCYLIQQSKRRHATSKTAPDELVVTVILYQGKRRR